MLRGLIQENTATLIDEKSVGAAGGVGCVNIEITVRVHVADRHLVQVRRVATDDGGRRVREGPAPVVQVDDERFRLVDAVRHQDVQIAVAVDVRDT